MSEEDRTKGLVDPEKLARWMDEKGLPGAGSPVEMKFITGGASNELFEIRRGDERMALRRPPRKVPKGRNETMLREYRVLEALKDTDVPHSRVLGACDDPSLFGACFYVMEFVDGYNLRRIFQKAVEAGYCIPLEIACYIMTQVCEGLALSLIHI